jgi:hypothetical protein
MVFHYFAAVALLGSAGLFQSGGAEPEHLLGARARLLATIQRIADDDDHGDGYFHRAAASPATWARRESPHGGTLLFVGQGGCSSVFSAETGALLRLTVDHRGLLREGWTVEPGSMLDEEACLAKAREYLSFLGVEADFRRIYTRSIDQRFLFEISLAVTDLPLSYHYDAYIEIDRRRGQMVYLRLPEIPDLSLAGSSQVPHALARQRGVEAYLRHRPFASADVKSGAVSLLVPAFARSANEMTPEHREMAAARRAIPILTLHVFDRTSWSESRKAHMRTQIVYVDARTGRAIAIEEMMAMAAGAGPKLAWPEGEISVAGAPLPGAALEAAAVPKEEPVAGKTVPLTIGDAIVLVSFDEKSGLCWMEAGGTRLYARPSGSLLEGLKRAPTVRLERFGAVDETVGLRSSM